MGKYDVWFKKEFDGRASEAAFLDLDYQWAGQMDAVSVKDLQAKIASTKAEDSKLDVHHRPLRAGDVVRGPDDAHWILTPVGIWSQVLAYENPPAEKPPA